MEQLLKPGLVFRLPPWALNALLVVGGALVGLLLAELLTFFLAPQPLTSAFLLANGEGGPIYQLDSALGMVLRPRLNQPFIFGTHVRTNALGLRDHEYGPKAPNEFRILSLGDSYAFGFGVEVEQSYAKVLERELNQAYPAARFSVINAGVSDYGTRQQRLAFQRLQPELQADFVLATFTAGNDIYDNAVFEERLRTGLRTPMGYIARHSHLARLILQVTYPVWFFLENRDWGHIARTMQLLKELEGDFASAHLPYLIVVIPARHQIRPRVEPAARMLIELGFENLVFRQNRSVVTHLKHDGAPYVDLWPALVARDSLTPVSFADDSHLNALGHEVAGHEVFLKLQHVLPAMLGRLRGHTDPRAN